MFYLCMIDGSMIDPLREYVRTGSSEVFKALVDAHVDAVYSQCLRLLHDPAAAEDVTQQVFITLAQKAARIPPNSVLNGWLFTATRYCCANYKRAAARRRSAECKAANMRNEAIDPLRADDFRSQAEPILDDAIAHLGQGDRDAVLMRFFQGQSLREVGNALGVSEDTARQRISRAVEKLRVYFARQGLTAPQATIAAFLGETIKPAAPGVAHAAFQAAISKSAAAATGHAAGLLSRAIWTWPKIAACVAAAVAVTGAVVVVSNGGKSPQAPSQPPPGQIAVGIDASAIASPPFTVSSQTTAITRPLQEDGRIDYVSALNQRDSQGVTLQNNGYVTWLHALGLPDFSAGKPPSSIREKTISLLGAQGLPAGGSIWEEYRGREPLDQSRIRMWKENEYPQFAAYLKRQDGSLDLAVEAVAAPKWWMPAVSTYGTLSWVLIPELNRMRSVANVLCGRALLRAKQGDFDGFLSDVTAVKRLARRTAGWTMVGHLVAWRINFIANETIGAAAGAGIFSGDQYAKLGNMLDGLDPFPPFWESLDSGERWSVLDSTQCIAMGKIQSVGGDYVNDQWFRTLKNIDAHSVDWDAVMSRLNGNYDEIVSISKAPSISDEQTPRHVFELKMSQMQADKKAHPDLAKEAGETNQAYTQRVADAIFLANTHGLWRAEDQCRLAVTVDQTTRALVAAAEYHGDKGNWPDALDVLIPAYLAQVPTNIFSKSGTEPVQYHKTDAGICLLLHGASGGGSSDTIIIGIVPNTP
jgi:RNA polymerase sigma factor (sigma-70 family)